MNHVSFGILAVLTFTAVSAAYSQQPIPVIYDSDIGSDIDDTWALALILASPEFDLKMVVTDSHDTVSRAKLAAKFLETVGRPDIPIGIGVKTGDQAGPQAKWAEEYELDQYPGAIHQDGVQAMIDLIRASEEPIVLFVVGPCPNIKQALRIAPDITKKIKEVFAMSGSVRIGYDGSATPDAEYNVREDIAASQAMYQADWKLTIAPLDTAGLVTLRGAKYADLCMTKNRLVETLLENYRVWVEEGKHGIDPKTRSSTLFDTVAVYLAIDDSLCEMETLNLIVDNKGYTAPNPTGRPIRAAMGWRDLGKYEDWLVERLKKGVARKK